MLIAQDLNTCTCKMSPTSTHVVCRKDPDQTVESICLLAFYFKMDQDLNFAITAISTIFNRGVCCWRSVNTFFVILKMLKCVYTHGCA